MARVPQADAQAALNGARVLIVEDDFFIRTDLASVLAEAGAEIVGPCAGVADALAAIGAGAPDAAILDVHLGTQTVGAVAQELTTLGIPFVFYTGQLGTDVTLDQWPRSRVLSKPSQPRTIVAALALLLKP